MSGADIDSVLEKHKDTFDRLEEKDTLEYDMSSYLLENMDSLKIKLKQFNREHHEFFPETLYNLYLDQYKEAAITLLRDEVGTALNLDPENRLRLTESIINKVAGELLSPTKETK
jgi:hypothetical protein